MPLSPRPHLPACSYLSAMQQQLEALPSTSTGASGGAPPSEALWQQPQQQSETLLPGILQQLVSSNTSGGGAAGSGSTPPGSGSGGLGGALDTPQLSTRELQMLQLSDWEIKPSGVCGVNPVLDRACPPARPAAAAPSRHALAAERRRGEPLTCLVCGCSLSAPCALCLPPCLPACRDPDSEAPRRQRLAAGVWRVRHCL